MDTMKGIVINKDDFVSLKHCGLSMGLNADEAKVPFDEDKFIEYRKANGLSTE
ncbi:hypothetical protein FACS1894166_10150 [Bacilli bacterium]|nr:hypothetical protein FACS1894166_10150 [Bacilli bacterium]